MDIIKKIKNYIKKINAGRYDLTDKELQTLGKIKDAFLEYRIRICPSCLNYKHGKRKEPFSFENYIKKSESGDCKYLLIDLDKTCVNYSLRVLKK